MTSKKKPEPHQWHVEPPTPTEEVEFVNETLGVPYSKEEVEDQVLEAKLEGKEKDLGPTKEDLAFRETVREEKAPAPKKQKRVRTRNELINLTRSLRKADDVDNRTCGKCLKRLPIEKFRRHTRSEQCEDCEE